MRRCTTDVKPVERTEQPSASPSVYLGPVSIADAPKILALMSVDICRKMAVDPIVSVEDARNFIRGNNNGNPDRFAVYHGVHGLIGSVGYTLSHPYQYKIKDKHKATCARVSYWLGEQYQRQGYGSAALEQLLAYLQKQGITRFEADVYADNSGSQKLLHKLGFVLASQQGGSARVLLFKKYG